HDDGADIGDTVLGERLHAGRVRRALAVVRVLRLELREAALRWLVAAGVLRHRLVDAALRVRVRRLPRRLGQLATLEQRGQVLGDAAGLARQALGLLGRRGASGQEQQPRPQGGPDRALRHEPPRRCSDRRGGRRPGGCVEPAHQTTTGTFVSTDFADACVTKSCPCRRTAIVARVRVAAGAAPPPPTSPPPAARRPLVFWWVLAATRRPTSAAGSPLPAGS